jgi:protein-tyrosine phosphatase
MTGMVDIHCHILPGIDDGPPDLPGAIDMARAAVNAGINVIAATPHLRSDFPKVRVDEIGDRCMHLRSALASEGIQLELVSGAEISLTWALEATDEDLRLASYAGTGTDVLIETPVAGGRMLQRLLYEVQLRGFRVTLAHPERLPEFRSDTALARHIVEQGVLLQVNAESLVSKLRGGSVAKCARNLCLSGLATVLASDAHSGHSRRCISLLAEGSLVIEREGGRLTADWLTTDAPGCVLSGRSLAERPKPKRRPRLFGAAFGRP